jgi:hypothetical protein
MAKDVDLDEEIKQRFAMLHLAWEEAYGTRKHDPIDEVRKYLHILAGVNAIWKGIGESKHYYRTSPNFALDSGLSVGICRSLCDLLINTHPKVALPDSLAVELMEVSIDLLERHICADVFLNQRIIKSFENVIHLLCLKSFKASEVAQRSVDSYTKLVNDADLDGSVFQDLIDTIGPSLAYREYVSSEDFDEIPQYWANDLYEGVVFDGFEHMGCELCWGPDSPETIASKLIRQEQLEEGRFKKE